MMRNVLTLTILLGINATSNAVPSRLDTIGSSSAAQLLPTTHSVEQLKSFSFDTMSTRTPIARPDAAAASLANMADMEASAALNQSAMLDTSGFDKCLMLFAALGLIVLQLRRKHKSLPQRPIVNGPIVHG